MKNTPEARVFHVWANCLRVIASALESGRDVYPNLVNIAEDERIGDIFIDMLSNPAARDFANILAALEKYYQFDTYASKLFGKSCVKIEWTIYFNGDSYEIPPDEIRGYDKRGYPLKMIEDNYNPEYFNAKYYYLLGLKFWMIAK